MGHNIASNRLLLIPSIRASRCIRVRHNLIGYHDGDSKLNKSKYLLNCYPNFTHLVCQPLKSPQELAKMTLASRQFTSTSIVRPIKSRA